MREIVTIQVGDFANYIGSHFWNFQDELLGLADDQYGDSIYKSSSLNMDVLYRSGETQQGVITYSPRLISVGLQGSLGSLSSVGSLYNSNASFDASDITTWTGNVTRYVSEPREKNLFLQSLSDEQDDLSSASNGADIESTTSQRHLQDKNRVECLENGVNYWTDFSKVQYHPRSLHELHGSWTDVTKFDNYGIGKDVLSEGFQGEELNDRLRLFVEECDHIQGIQFIVDDSGGFSGVAAEFLENIADEYTNTPVLLYAVRDPHSSMQATNRMQSVSRSLHDAISISRFSSYCKLIVPVGLPSLKRSKLSSILNIEDHKLFHCSAVYAAALHSISLPFRMDFLSPTSNASDISGAIDVDGIVQILAGQGRQNMVAALDVAMPAPSLTNERSPGSLLRSLCTLAPDVDEDADDPQAVESLIFQGMLKSGGRAELSEVNDSICAAYECGLPKPKFSHVSVSLCPLPIPLPFPSIFRSRVGRRGELLCTPAGSTGAKGSLEVDSIPMAARLRSSKIVKPLIERQLNSLRKHGMARGALGAGLLESWGFGRDEVEDMGEILAKMAMELDPRSQMSSDSDSD